MVVTLRHLSQRATPVPCCNPCKVTRILLSTLKAFKTLHGPDTYLFLMGDSVKGKELVCGHASLSFFCDLSRDLHRPSQSAEFELLGEKSENSHDSSTNHEMRTAPLLTRDAFMLVAKEDVSMQYGVLGETLAIRQATILYSWPHWACSDTTQSGYFDSAR